MTATTAFPVRPALKPEPATTAWNLAVAQTIARNLVQHHLGFSWTVEFKKVTGTAGKCVYGTKTLIFSKAWTLELGREEFRQTVLHEIGHAIAGYGHAHDAVWADAVRSIGGTPNKHVDVSKHEYDSAKIFKWTITCPCGKVKMHRSKKSQKLERSICLTCGKRVILTQNF